LQKEMSAPAIREPNSRLQKEMSAPAISDPWGAPGPKNALAPGAMLDRQELRLPDALMVRVGLKTDTNQQTEEYAAAERLFLRAGAAPSGPDGTPALTKPLFIAFATQHWPWDVARAAAAFNASDYDGSGRLNRHEFAMLVRALIKGKPGDEAIPELAKMRARAEQLYQQEKLERSEARVVLDPRSCASTATMPAGIQVCSVNVGGAAVNAELVLDETLRVPAGADWRGALAQPRDTVIYKMAIGIVEAARLMAHEVLVEKDVADGEWLRGGASLARLLGRTCDAQAGQMLQILSAEVQRLAAAQPTVVKVPTPAKVFGDVHGQLRDLLMLFAHHGFPYHHRGGDVELAAYVFNGDWVDRGHHQLDVVALLFALKALYPARVFLVRGNHEFRSINEHMGDLGFKRHVEAVFVQPPNTGYVHTHTPICI
jgi:hypothetical protein